MWPVIGFTKVRIGEMLTKAKHSVTKILRVGMDGKNKSESLTSGFFILLILHRENCHVSKFLGATN